MCSPVLTALTGGTGPTGWNSDGPFLGRWIWDMWRGFDLTLIKLVKEKQSKELSSFFLPDMESAGASRPVSRVILIQPQELPTDNRTDRVPQHPPLIPCEKSLWTVLTT